MIKKTFYDFILTLEGNSADQSKLDNDVEEYNPESWEKHKVFLHKFHEALEELPSPSWTDIAKSGKNFGRRALDSEEAWYDIHNELKAVGFTWQDVKNNKDVILDNLECYSSLNAYVDIILYNLDDNYNVGGWSVDVESDFDEIVVKYRYGYHQTTYGRVFLKRYWGSVENFIEKYAKNILKLFIHDTGCIDRSDMKDILQEIDEEVDDAYIKTILRLYLVLCLRRPRSRHSKECFLKEWAEDTKCRQVIDLTMLELHKRMHIY